MVWSLRSMVRLGSARKSVQLAFRVFGNALEMENSNSEQDD